MIKKIREEKTYQQSNTKTGVKEALEQIDNVVIEKKGELEEEWVDELITRKRIEVQNIPPEDEYDEDKEEEKQSNYHSASQTENYDQKMSFESSMR